MNTIYLSLGSNIGNRYEYILQAISLLSRHISNIKHSRIYETKPWGYYEQGPFLNMMIRAKTELSPQLLLDYIHQIQDTIGRNKTILNGPRTIDIDIVFYDQSIVQEHTLTIPHPRAHERDFVLVPMMDIDPDFPHPILHKTIKELLPTMNEPFILQTYIPTQIVGILNLSPESFGGESYTDLPSILIRVEQMIAEGANIIDLGAQSTKPGSVQLPVEEELRRLRGVIKAIKERFPDLRLSVDTTRPQVARLALDEGVDMLNDISGGRFAPEILSLIVNTDVKMVITHSQGSFTDMHARYQYDDIITELLEYFQRKVQELLKIGIKPDQIILDPGIGFSKGSVENFTIIKNIEKLKALGFPIYIGLSRKKFIGTVTEKVDAQDRDVGSTVLHTLCIQKGADYIRTHNVDQLRDAVSILKNF